MRTRMVLVLCAALALAVGVATATAGGGNSDAAKACQKGGWMNLVRADGSSFKNEGDCVSYAAQGGALTTRYAQARSDCATYGGTFAQGTGTTAWTCTDWVAHDATEDIHGDATFFFDCFADVGAFNITDVRTGPAGFPTTFTATCSF